MDLYDTGTSADLVVAEGSTLSGGLNNSKHRPMGSSRLGQAVPLHLLHSSIPKYHGARLYSSSTSSSLPQSPEEQTAEEDLQTDVTPSLLQAPTLTAGPDSGFASLKSLFGNPRRSWSSPQPPTHEDVMIADTQPGRSAQGTNSSDKSFDSSPSEDYLYHEEIVSTAEKEDEKAHEMLSSSTSTVKAQQQNANFSLAEQPLDANDANVVLESSSPLTSRPQETIARDWSELSQNPHQVIRFKKAVKEPKTIRTVEAARDHNQSMHKSESKPRPPPVWKINPEDLQLPPQSNKRKTNTSTASTSVKPMGGGDVVQTGSSQAQLGKSETDFLDSSESTSTSPSSVEKAELSNDVAATTLTHLTSTGEAHMVDVGGKDFTERVAVAVGFVHFGNDQAYKAITENLNKKGDVLGVARVAGIMAAKKCSDIIPLCHPIPITKITLNVGTVSRKYTWLLRPLTGRHPMKYGIAAVEARVHTRGQTGVEMEALTAVSGACLTIYDMCKAVDRDMIISSARVLYKEGGRSGTYLHAKFADHSVNDRFIKMDQDISPSTP